MLKRKRLDETPLLSKQNILPLENSNTTPIRTNFSPKRMFCVLKIIISMRLPLEANRRYSCLKKHQNISDTHSDIKKKILKNSLFTKNVPCSVCSKETSHRDTHLSTQNIFLILTNIFIISHQNACSFSSKEMSL